MTEENNTQASEQVEQEQPKVHHQTKRAADLALSKKVISPDSHKAILAGELGLEAAKELGREGSPYGPAVRVNKADRGRDCLCGCGLRTRGGRFRSGHDQRLVTYAKEYVRGDRELTDEQLAYVQESGKLDRAKAQVAKEDARKQEKAQKKAEAQRKREGEAEAAKREKEDAPE